MVGKSSRSPKVNKSVKGRLTNAKHTKYAQKHQAEFADGNNNAQLLQAEESGNTGARDKTGKMSAHKKVGDTAMPNEQDHIQVSVNDSEDDISFVGDQDVLYNNANSDSESEVGSEQDQTMSDPESGSEVVIAPHCKTEEQEFEDEMMKLAKNPTSMGLSKV